MKITFYLQLPYEYNTIFIKGVIVFQGLFPGLFFYMIFFLLTLDRTIKEFQSKYLFN